MAICRLMIEDFMHQTGRYPKCFNRLEAYSDNDLIEGIEFGKWLIEDFNLKQWPHYGFSIKKFINWAESRLTQPPASLKRHRTKLFFQ
jgi:hypothetical protein